MRKIAANFIFPISSPPIKNGVVVLDDNGLVIDVIDRGGQVMEDSNLEFYNGIICPGFVNAHCHLELSHLKGKISQKRKLSGFIQQLLAKRNDDMEPEIAAQKADKYMREQGIVGVGDICNTDDTLDIKKHSSVYYHNFVEVFSMDKTQAVNQMAKGNLLKQTYNLHDLSASIVPHAPYSVAPELFKSIGNFSSPQQPVSIHFLESPFENDLLLRAQGELFDFFKSFSEPYVQYSPTKKDVVELLIDSFKPQQHMVLVHNTFISKNDIVRLKNYFEVLFFVLCPRSNQYIEGQLPPIDLFDKADCTLALGTDSLASNTSLSLLEEMKLIHEAFPEISLDKILSWATLNGAKAIKAEADIGSIEKGKKPGLNLLFDINLQNLSLQENTKLKVLI